MSTRKPHFKARIGCARLGNEQFGAASFLLKDGDPLVSEMDDFLVRITDAREMTAVKAVERVMQMAYEDGHSMEDAAKAVGMAATVRNGKVRVRRAKP